MRPYQSSLISKSLEPAFLKLLNSHTVLTCKIQTNEMKKKLAKINQLVFNLQGTRTKILRVRKLYRLCECSKIFRISTLTYLGIYHQTDNIERLQKNVLNRYRSFFYQYSCPSFSTRNPGFFYMSIDYRDASYASKLGSSEILTLHFTKNLIHREQQ